MDSIKTYMEDDHKRCDDLFIRAEGAVAQSDWTRAAEELSAFSQALEHHLQAEESILFPAFEVAIASRSGPTAVMRAEHQQIRSLTASLARAVSRRDADQFSGDADTLTILVQQHNLKEEDVLYVMMDRVLGMRRTELLTAIATTALDSPKPALATSDTDSHAER